MIAVSPRLLLYGAIAAVAVSVVVAQVVRVSQLKGELADTKALMAQQRLAAVNAAIDVMKVQLIERDRRERITQEALNDERAKNAALVADHAAAIGAGQQLRAAATRAASRCAGVANPAHAGGGPAAPDAGLVFADVLGRMESRGRELAELAGLRGLAGETCERERDALTSQR